MSTAWMPMYWGDYIKDTRHLSAAEHGAYLMLIAHYWTTGNPPPDDDTRLARIVGMTIDEWMAARMAVASFWHIADGVWCHARIEAELDTAHIRVLAKSKAGAIGAKKRWQKDSNSNGKRIADAPVCHKQTDAQSQSHITPHSPPVGDRFDEFWSSYPHRGKHPDPKKPAFEKWERKVRAGADPAEIIAGAKAYADTVRSERIEPQHVAQAVTWLNQERWEDCKEPELTPEEIAALRSVRGEDDLELPAFLDRRGAA